MNVKEGDLAIVTVASGWSDGMGKIVKVLHPDPEHIQSWIVETTSPGIGVDGYRYSTGETGWIWDAHLRPISGLPEDTLTEKEKENETR